jgi:hypothetical protein
LFYIFFRNNHLFTIFPNGYKIIALKYLLNVEQIIEIMMKNVSKILFLLIFQPVILNAQNAKAAGGNASYSIEPLSELYYSCNGFIITIGFKASQGVAFYWYTTETGDSPVANGSNVNSVTVTKDNSPVQIWWAEPRYNGQTLARIPVKVLLGSCEIDTPPDCVNKGTPLFQEDFDRYGDGLNPDSEGYSLEPLPNGLTTYTHFTDFDSVVTEGCYVLAKRGKIRWTVNNTDDHTSPDNATIGRSFMINGKQTKDKVYEQIISGLCSESKLYFSFWAGGNEGKLIWRIYASDGRVLATFGQIRMSSWQWKEFGFPFTLPKGETSVRFEIYNEDDRMGHNDVRIDDIGIYLCISEVELALNHNAVDTVCLGSKYTFRGKYSDDGAFGNKLVYNWEYSKTGIVQNPADWHIIGSQGTSNNGKITAEHTIPVMNKANGGYYRLVITNSANINSNNCRATSKPVHIIFRSDAKFAGKPSFNHSAISDSLTINLKVTNYGNSSFASPLYVAAYRNSVNTANKIATNKITKQLNDGDTVDVNLVIKNFSNYMPFNNIIIRVNDNGGGNYIQTECDYSNNEINYPFSDIVMAQHDYVKTTGKTPVTTDVSANDNIKDKSKASISILSPSAKGTTVINNSKITYTNNSYSGKAELDSFTYKICATGDCSKATVRILTRSLPKILIEEECSFNPSLKLDFQYENATCEWQYRAKASDQWKAAGTSSEKLQTVNEGEYRVKIVCNGQEVFTETKKLIIEKKLNTQLNKIWYKIRLQ